jgi:alpha-glucoside transport system permease protein
LSGTSITAEPPVKEAPPPVAPAGRDWRSYGTAAIFLLPAVALLAIWIIYPAVYTVARSLYGPTGFDEWVGLDNYEELFRNDIILQAIKNNAIWVGVVPALVTAIGLVFAVLTERVRWSVAFKTAVFMPMAISLLAAGVIWRLMYFQDPDRGTVNAGLAVVKDAIDPPGALSDALPATEALTGNPQQGLTLKQTLEPGSVTPLPLTGIAPEDVPDGAEQGRRPEAVQNGITGVVWRDFKPGGGTPGRLEQDELGLPGVTVQLRDSDGDEVASTKTAANGTFEFDDLEPGSYQASIGKSTFAKPYAGVSWLGERLITPAIIISYIWVWAGFAMVVIAAGLAAIPRDLLEAARTDGAGEWQVFRRVTVPLLAPVLSVVFITMVINVLKVFDIVISVAPGSVQDDANVIALAMWRTSFGGVNDFGLGSAIAVFLFALVIPVLLINIRRFRREV